MVLHRNAKLGLAGRYALVRAVEDDARLAADRLPLAAALVRCEFGRPRDACLPARPLEPARRMPWLLSGSEQRRICAARRRTGWGPRLLALQTGHAHSTISKVLAY